MLSLVQNWFAPKANPIGVDFGSDSLRLAQVQYDGQAHKLFAAASCDVPAFVQGDLESRLDFLNESIRDLLTQGKFRGRQAVLSLPASLMFVQHLRLPKMNDAQLKKAIRAETKGKLPIDPDAALMRHLIAGEVQHRGQTMLEVIAVAAAREAIDKYLAVAHRAKLNVIGMKIEPVAVIDCFSHVHRRKIDANVTSLYVDLGGSGTRAIIAQGTHILFVRPIDIGGHHYNTAVAAAMDASMEDARLLRLKQAASESSMSVARDIRNVSPAKPVAADPQLSGVDAACAPVTVQLAEQLLVCRRQHEATFPNSPVERVIFVGGESRHRSLCTQIAEAIGLPAQIGDPLVRMGRASQIPIETGIDRRLPQPAWAVAIGLSFDAPHLPDDGDTLSARELAGAAR